MSSPSPVSFFEDKIAENDREKRQRLTRRTPRRTHDPMRVATQGREASPVVTKPSIFEPFRRPR